MVSNNDGNAARDRVDRISNIVGSYLLRGYKMLAEECGDCGTVMLEDRSKVKYCVGCEEVDRPSRAPNNEAPNNNVQAPNSRQDIYEMLASGDAQAFYSMSTASVASSAPTPPCPPIRTGPLASSSTAPSRPATVASTNSNSAAVDSALASAILSLASSIETHTDITDSAHIKTLAETIQILRQTMA